MATVIEKETAILNALASQGALLSSVADAINKLSIPNVDTTALQTSIDKVDAHVAEVEALIGSDTPPPAPAPAPAPTPVDAHNA